MSQLFKFAGEFIEVFYSLGVVVCGFYVIWVLFSALTK